MGAGRHGNRVQSPTELWVLGADGSGTQVAAITAGHLDSVRWAPDGRRLRYSKHLLTNRRVARTIWEVRLDGSGLRQLVPEWGHSSAMCCGAWSPDGRHYVFSVEVGEASQIWLLAEAGRAGESPSPILLTDGPLSFYEPTWSPDGTQILVLGVQPGGELLRYDGGVRAFLPFLRGFSARHVSFARTGEWMVYSVYPQHTLWRARIDGSDRRQLTYAPFRVDGVQVSPDGEWLAVRGASPGQQDKIYLLPSTGGTLEPITPGDVAQGIPTWSADSRDIAFGDVPATFGQPAGNEVIHLFDRLTREFSDVPGSHGLWTSRFSPDGRSLAALTIRGQELRLFDLKSRRWRALPVAHLSNPQWSRDSRFLYYETEGGEPHGLRRVRVSDGHVEDIASLEPLATPASMWSGLALTILRSCCETSARWRSTLWTCASNEPAGSHDPGSARSRGRPFRRDCFAVAAGAIRGDRIDRAAGAQPRHRQDRRDVGRERLLQRLQRHQRVVAPPDTSASASRSTRCACT